MRIPGFNAEASLYKTLGNYQSAPSALGRGNGVIPALDMKSLQRPDIIVSCVCPCCICIDGLCFCCGAARASA
jgi:hypothetical protein